ncbi:hypothetical protein CC86DRAFT_76668 [Ophiobolus disseminans]|uniref:DUF6590 domain-containing protein n=1 Tax=Ophiobolus disseminans TaxID=1469910 RepID=A0A6A6ZRS3_9PLEO|nr:hypothetical protein CC86DRAFT_76668 [Ophiobolus disseminans]
MSTLRLPVVQEATAFSPTKKNGGDSGILSQLQTELRMLSTLQEQLSEQRQQVLIDRQRLVSSTKRIQKLRDKAADAEVRLMDTLRRVHNDVDSSTPTELTLVYAEVEERRNDLVAMETRHVGIEQELEVSEWSLTEKEEDLYQRDIENLLSGDYWNIHEESVGETSPEKDFTKVSLEPSAGVQYQVDMLAYRRVRRHFNDLRKGNIDMTDHTSKSAMKDASLPHDHAHVSDIERLFGDALGHMIRLEVKLQSLKLNLFFDERAHNLLYRAHSDPGRDIVSHYEGAYMPRQARSEGGDPRLKETTLHTSNIEGWLFHCLEMNIINKMCYMAIIEHKMMNRAQQRRTFDDLEESAFEAWMHDTSEVIPYRETKLSVIDSFFDKPQEDLQILNSAKQQSGNTSPKHVRRNPESVWSGDLGLDLILSPPVEPSLQVPLFSIEDLDLGDSSGSHHTLGHEEDSSLHGRPHVAQDQLVPEWTVTAPDEEHKPDAQAIVGSNQLETGGPFPPRCDSVHNSGLDRELRIDRASADAPDAPTVAKASDLDLCPFPALDQSTATQPTELPKLPETSGVARYTPWTWSPDLRLLFQNGFGVDDEIIEATWQQFTKLDPASPSQDTSVTTHYPNQTSFGNATDGSRSSFLYAQPGTVSRRSSDNSRFTTSGAGSPQPEAGPSRRGRPQYSSRSTYGKSPVENQPSDLKRVPLSQYRRFWILGKVFRMIWRETSEYESQYFSPQSSRESSPQRNFSSSYDAMRYFVVVKPRDTFSICV